MPGPGNKRKVKGSKNTKSDANAVSLLPSGGDATTATIQCLTVEEDEITLCGRPATEGYPRPDRCKVHHGQYRTLYKKYKDASKVVDDVKRGGNLPTEEQIERYTDWHVPLEKARWVRKYLEAIRVEKTGREIHQSRFFLKVDDGHKLRIKLLKKEMVRTVDVLDALQGKAYRLYGSLHDIKHEPLSTVEVNLEKQSKRTTEKALESIENPEDIRDLTVQRLKKTLSVKPNPGEGDEDLIQISLRNQKEGFILVFKPFVELESFIEMVAKEANARPNTEYDKSMVEKQFFIYQQFVRRIIFQEPTLFMKAIEKVSFKDLILSDDYSIEDMFRFMELFMRPLEFPLKWFKDAVLDALAMSRHGTAANVGRLENRIPLLGGWVFNRSHTASMSNEAWWLLLKIVQPPANVENRFVRLCSSFDDLLGFLSFAALGLVPCPNFCQERSYFDVNDPSLSRNHLSLCGVVVADMVSTDRPPQMCGPMPTTRRATRRDCIMWATIETRAYMFGAVRNDPGDVFVDAFLRELRARPDLFQVVLRSETAPGRQVETFGSGPANNEALPAMCACQFEAPPRPQGQSPAPPSYTSSQWQVFRSAVDVLYGTGKEIQGYLTLLSSNPQGWFFRFKTFLVTYFVILDTVPNRDQSVLARNVAWAALRAGGHAEGEYTVRKYAVATDNLFEQCARERLGKWMPDGSWSATKMVDQLDLRGM